MNLTKSDIETFESLKCYIESQIHQRIPIAELCKMARMGENKLTRGFKFLFQFSIAHYQHCIAMEYAKILLEDGMQVKEVAIVLGYASTGHFTRAFSRLFNQSPIDSRSL